ncbi:GNAT family N-acetyltransferase [Blastococcus saxobsidens]|uniref:Acetyltransferase, N-acetylglutamate synthase n=1 Tax=Blastococcus saxobsidens (strain DD2) TaxID=1146883 RepID=H6RJ86_BLASD|nr:GNAT family N-acetyltransferase [Blastococcus saxobsidens]CCG04831.1 Acetyltransferase, N-acetylglutamate synthase [Blastococcus saxobsidens DD2]
MFLYASDVPPPSQLAVVAAGPEDFPAIAELTVRVYLGGDLASPDYTHQLADVAGRAVRSELLVVHDPGGRLVGSVALVLDGDFGEITETDDEAAFRMLAVDPAARGRGVGELLVTTCLERARAAGRRRMVLSTDPRMVAAHRLYRRLGFVRMPERDWSPVPGIDLLVYGREL